MERLTRVELGERIRAELERRRVGRDNPVHQRLLAGTLTRAELREFGRQHWRWHRAYPGFLALVAGNCPDPDLRAWFLELAYEQETGRISGTAGRVAQWEAVCACWGLTPNDLAGAEVLPTTAAQNAAQELVARRSFAEGAMGILLGAPAEAAPFMAGRRQAMAEHYGVGEDALRYFAGQVTGDPIDDYLDRLYPHVRSRAEQEAGLVAIRLVLNARWGFFSGLAARPGDG